jgi:hypothetical protein
MRPRSHPGRVYDTRSGSGDVTAGFDLTPAYGVFNLAPPPPVREPNAWRTTRTLLVVLGAIALIVVLCGVGMFLVGSTVCPCTFGMAGQPTTSTTHTGGGSTCAV